MSDFQQDINSDHGLSHIPGHAIDIKTVRDLCQDLGHDCPDELTHIEKILGATDETFAAAIQKLDLPISVIRDADFMSTTEPEKVPPEGFHEHGDWDEADSVETAIGSEGTEKDHNDPFRTICAPQGLELASYIWGVTKGENVTKVELALRKIIPRLDESGFLPSDDELAICAEIGRAEFATLIKTLQTLPAPKTFTGIPLGLGCANRWAFYRLCCEISSNPVIRHSPLFPQACRLVAHELTSFHEHVDSVMTDFDPTSEKNSGKIDRVAQKRALASLAQSCSDISLSLEAFGAIWKFLTHSFRAPLSHFSQTKQIAQPCDRPVRVLALRDGLHLDYTPSALAMSMQSRVVVGRISTRALQFDTTDINEPLGFIGLLASEKRGLGHFIRTRCLHEEDQEALALWTEGSQRASLLDATNLLLKALNQGLRCEDLRGFIDFPLVALEEVESRLAALGPTLGKHAGMRNRLLIEHVYPDHVARLTVLTEGQASTEAGKRAQLARIMKRLLTSLRSPCRAAVLEALDGTIRSWSIDDIREGRRLISPGDIDKIAGVTRGRSSPIMKNIHLRLPDGGQVAMRDLVMRPGRRKGSTIGPPEEKAGKATWVPSDGHIMDAIDAFLVSHPLASSVILTPHLHALHIPIQPRNVRTLMNKAAARALKFFINAQHGVCSLEQKQAHLAGLGFRRRAIAE